jgi:hypothetical protein
MLFYGKEIDIFYIILLVIFILVVYILISYYMQQKQSIALTTSSQPIIDTTSTTPIPLYLKKDSKETLKRGAFAISLWLNIDSWVQVPLATDKSFNILTMNNTPNNQIFRLYIDNTCNLSMNSTFLKNDLNILGNYRITGGGDNDGNNVNIGAGNNTFQVSGAGKQFNDGNTLTYTIPSGSYNADTLTKMIQNVMNSEGKWTATPAIPAAPPNFYIQKNVTTDNYEFGFNYAPNDESRNLTITLVGNKDGVGVPFDSRLIFGVTTSQTTFTIFKKPAAHTFNPIVNGNATSVLPINEPVNVILNYNGDDDYNEAKNQFFTANDGTKIEIYNTNTGFADSNRALDVFINGRLNNTIILNTSLTKNDKGTGTPNCKASCVSYNDASMNYFIDDNIQFLIGSVSTVTPVTPGPVGTISNVTFIKDGCSVQDAQSIYDSGNSSNILDNLFSYKLQFSLLEDDKKVKTVEFL